MFNGRYDFLAREQEAAALAGITQGDVVAFYTRHIAPGSDSRRKLCVRIEPTRTPGQAAGGTAGPAPPGPGASPGHECETGHEIGQHAGAAGNGHVGGSSPMAKHNKPRVLSAHGDGTGSPRSPAKRRRQQQHQHGSQKFDEGLRAEAALAAAAGKVVVAADLDAWKRGCALYPATMAVQPSLS